MMIDNMKAEELQEEGKTDESYHDYLFKIILIGNGNVGKSSILRSITGCPFVDNYDTTIGMDFGVFLIKIEDKIIKLQIWDTAGQETFRTITKVSYRGAKCVILWYDITSRESFDSLDSWLKEIQNNIAEDTILYLAANKADKEVDSEVKYEEGVSFAKNNKFDYFCETSARTSKGVKDLFFRIGKQLYIKYKGTQSKSKVISDNKLQNFWIYY